MPRTTKKVRGVVVPAVPAEPIPLEEEQPKPGLSAYWVVIFGDRLHPYRLPEIKLCRVVRETPQTVRLSDGDRQWNEPKHRAYRLPTLTSWHNTQAISQAYQQALDALADGLRESQRYDKALHKAVANKIDYPNPLTPTVIEVYDPDREWNWSEHQSFKPPTVTRLEAERHTEKMLRTQMDGKAWGMQKQEWFFLCPDDAYWEKIEALQKRCEEAEFSLRTHLQTLGKFGSPGIMQAEDWSEESDRPDFNLNDWVRVVGTDFIGTVINISRGDGLVALTMQNGQILLFEPDKLEPIVEEPLPQRPGFSEGDRVRGELAQSPGTWIEGIVDTQNDAVVFVSNAEYQFVGLSYEGLELIERAEPQESAPDAFDELMATLGEELDDDPYIQAIQRTDDALTTALQPGDYVTIEAEDDLTGNIVPVVQILPTFEIEVDYQGIRFAYERHQLRLYGRADEQSLEYIRQLRSPAPLTPISEVLQGEIVPAYPADDIEPAWATQGLSKLDALKHRANEKHRASVKKTVEAIYDMREAGLALIEVRSDHEERGDRTWLKWLAQNFEGSRRTAYYYIDIAENWQETVEPYLQRAANSQEEVTYRKVLALLGKAPVEEGDEDPPEQHEAAVTHQADMGDRMDRLEAGIQARIGGVEDWTEQVESSDAPVSGQLNFIPLSETYDTPPPTLPRQSEPLAPVETPPLPKQKYLCLVIDPPWKYELRSADDTHRNRIPYPPMETSEILALPVSDLVDKEGAVLWLWTTNNFMAEAIACLQVWGFELKTILTWEKTTQTGSVHIGTGHWLRNATEHCLLATSGKVPSFKHTGTLTNQSTVIRAPRREHSRKPEEFYELVEALCPTESRLEMFARQQRPGWEVWGNETSKFA